MKKLHFKIDINAPKEKVWKVLWGADTYPKWTSVFSEGSNAVSDWKEGSRIEFTDGKGAGMYAIIDKNKPNEFMSFKHQGEIVDGKDKPGDESWAGAMENYTLKENAGTTNLSVDIDVTPDFEKMFSDIFPKGLKIVKELSEK
jgi:hypothetical protein